MSKLKEEKWRAKMLALCPEEFLKTKKAVDPQKALLEVKTKQTLNFIYGTKNI